MVTPVRIDAMPESDADVVELFPDRGLLRSAALTPAGFVGACAVTVLSLCPHRRAMLP